ncbi:hypothetical protein LP415_07490 [Polaromonas sp. P1(28)-8]|nr:hypothetical protein LP415_07490 [Polaromonas sp. P1(28)-8]
MKSELIEVSKAKIESGTVMAATHSLKLSQPVMAKQRATAKRALSDAIQTARSAPGADSRSASPHGLMTTRGVV